MGTKSRVSINYTASNVGATGSGIFKDKTGTTLNFRKLVNAGGIGVAINGDNVELTNQHVNIADMNDTFFGTLVANDLIQWDGTSWINVQPTTLPISTASQAALDLKEDSSNKSTLASEFASTTKFPVWAAIVAYFTGSRIRQLFGFIDATVNTTNATVTPILTIPITTIGDYFRYMIIVKGKSSTNNVTYSVEVTYRNVGGVVSLVGSSALSRQTTFSPAGSTTLTFTSSGTNGIINVQGVAATNMTWEASYYKMI